MDSELRLKSGTIVLRLGVVNLNTAAAKRLRLEVLPMLQAGEGIVLDMKGVEFADTSGLGSLCALVRGSSEECNIVLAQCSHRLQTILAKVPKPLLPRQFSTITEAVEAVARCSRSITDSSIEPPPSTVAFALRLPISTSDDSWINQGSQRHGHVD